jgi:hypothetical protein
MRRACGGGGRPSGDRCEARVARGVTGRHRPAALSADAERTQVPPSRRPRRSLELEPASG